MQANGAVLYQDLPELSYETQLQNLERELQSIPKSKPLDRSLVTARIGIVKAKMRAEEATAAIEEVNERPRGIRRPSVEDPAPHAEIIRQYTLEVINKADQRAMFFLAATVALLSFMLTHNAPVGWFKGMSEWWFSDFLSFGSVFGLAASAAFMLSVLYPVRNEVSLSRVARAKSIALRRGFWVGVVSAFGSLLFLILAASKHHTSHRIY